MSVRRILLLTCLVSALAFGQAQISSGDIRGTVVDASGGALAGALVTAHEQEQAIIRATRADDAGHYHLASLPPGVYRVRFEQENFTTKIVEGVVVRVGENVTLRANLAVGALTTEVNITAETPVIEPDRTQQASTIESMRLAALPINRRSYLDFALLAPGVVETNDMVDGTDFRVAQAPHSGLSFGGSNGRGNAVSIDGIANYYNSGGVRPSLGQEAVREFQINRNSFSAEFGGAVGGAVNIVSKAGTNGYHGTLFGFLRHRDIQARNYFDPQKSAFTRGQAGATAGGPLRRDRTFFFASLERLDRHETAFVPIMQDRSAFGRLTPAQQQLADFFNASGSAQLRGLAGAMNHALIPKNNPRTVALFDQNSGNFPFSEGSTQASLRLDHRFTERHSLFLRGNITSDLSQNAQLGALIAFNRGRSLDVFDSTLMASDSFMLNPRWIVETRVGFGYNRLGVIPTDPNGPEINITGYGSFGREIFLPSTIYERHFQAQQTWNAHRSRHEVKFGADINPVRDTVISETFFSGRFSFGSRVPLGLVLNSVTGDPNFAANLGATLASLGQQRLIPNLQSTLTALQSYSLGLPEFYQQGFGDPTWMGWTKRYGMFLQDSWRLRSNFTLNVGVRYELEANPKPVNTDGNNIAPRIGFAWTPSSDGRTVVRGGFGMYYAQINQQVANVADTLSGRQIGQVFVPLTPIGLINPKTGKPLVSSDVYQTLLAQGILGRRPIQRGDIAQFNLQPSGTAPLAVVFGITPDFVNPYAHQASIEVERAVGEWAVSAAYNFNRAVHLPRILDRNLYYSGRRPDGAPTFGFYNPMLSQKNIFESTANSFYHALILQVSRRMSRNFAVNAHYTFSKAIDEVTDFNTDFQPNDQLNARAERSLSPFHQAHRVVANAVIESPLRPGQGKGAVANLFGGFQLSPILTAGSGRPFNVLAGVDNLGDRHSTTHRPLGAGRDIGRGPDYFSLDARLSRRFQLGKQEARNLEFTAEGFNLFNRTNFRSLNNTVGDIRLEDLPRPLTGRRGIPTEPLSFTSAFDPRQFQFGLKIHF